MPEVCANCVLLVDDDSSLRDLLSRQLEKEGLQAIHAEDGIDALVKLRDVLPRVIISDLKMPRMTGFEFIAVVRRRFPTIPVVVLTGSISSEFSAEIKPDCWFEKSMLQFPVLVQTVKYLARTTPDQVSPTQVTSLPVQKCPGGSGDIALTCTDCLRAFDVARTGRNTTVEQTAVCVHCQASVPFLFESSEPQ